jgi:tricorn protease-like protein
MNQYNLSFDIWLANSQNPYRANITTEIMIWEDKSLIFPYISPINLSPIVGNFTTGNITYDLVKYIHQDTPPWTYLAFIPRSAINTVDRTIDLMPFLNYLRANSHIVATDYLCNVSFGNEIIEGSGANTLTEFSVTLATTPSTDHFIVFDRSVAGHPDIFIANTDGTNVTNLTNNSADDFHPRLNPANDRVLFISNRSGQANVYIMNLDGSNVQQVTTGGVSGGQNNVWYRAFADFTSDSKIVYCKGNKLYKINVDGTNNIAIATAPSDNWERVSCSRAGNKIAALTMGSWSYNEKIYIMNPDGSNMQVLVPDNPGGIYLGTFSPDGSKIAYIYDISGHEESSGCQLNNHVFLINIDGTNNTDISGGKVSGTCDFYPAITDDGQKVIFSNGPGCGGGTSSPNIWMMNIDGSNRQQIITDGYVLDTN